MLTRLTITGADDQTEIGWMAEQSKRYRFLEWGILVGGGRGYARFPSLEWIRRLCDAKWRCPEMRLSLHLCGAALDVVVFNKAGAWWRPFATSFARVQMNTHAIPVFDRFPETINNTSRFFINALRDVPIWKPEIIVQLDGVNDCALRALDAIGHDVSGLHDASHGAGAKPASWPKSLGDGQKFYRQGWAGGLGPENICEELPRIDAEAQGVTDAWIDMETRVRKNTDLCPSRVELVLSEFERWSGSNGDIERTA